MLINTRFTALCLFFSCCYNTEECKICGNTRENKIQTSMLLAYQRAAKLKKKEKLMKAASNHVINVSNTFGTVASLSMLYKIKKSKQKKQNKEGDFKIVCNN